MSATPIYPIHTGTHLTPEQYQSLYQSSIHEPQKFWALQAERFITWIKPWKQVLQGNLESGDCKWFVDGKLNACFNALDRHLQTRANQVAVIWEGNEPGESQALTYADLHQQVCRFANVLKAHGIQKGDRIGIYLPMIPEVVVAMLASARIGAVHTVVFAGFSPDALRTRLLDADCKLVITADEGFRDKKIIPLKKNMDEALEACDAIQSVIVVKRSGNPVAWDKERDRWYHEVMSNASADCPIEPMDALDPLFVLYTSGSTGKPKGVVHSTGGYLVYVAITHHYVFDIKPNDVYWCTADVGWITGHSYLIYGPLINGTSTVLFEGVPNYPNHARYWDIIDKYQVNVFYTSPTALRALRREGDDWLAHSTRASLRVLGSVGEPINPDVWEWYYHLVGQARCSIVNTWWQTETGGILVTALPGVTPLVPGAAGVPFFGVKPAIVDELGNPIHDTQSGHFVITQPWPGLMQTILNNKQRFIETYLQQFPGNYLTGDGAHRDADGNLWITGRDDDIIKVSGHRLGTEELESALVSHPAISEAAVVGIPHPIKGEAIVAFVSIKVSFEPSHELKQALIQQVREKIGALATPEHIQWSDALPKTRSGKIMRRILRKIACNELDNLGDVSTLADPSVLDKIISDWIKY